MAAQLCAEAEEADSVVGETQGRVAAVRQWQPVGRGLIEVINPDAAGVGELLCGGTCERVLLVCQRLGRKEDSAASAAGAETEGLRLEAME